jgi:cytoskeletal protein CcmA (bactofilin family)
MLKKRQITIEKADIKAFLGPGSKFEGKLSFDELVRLDGRFTGEIHSSDTLIVGDTAEVSGDIHVGCLILSGKFKGNIIANQRVELKAPAHVEGMIQTAEIKIEEKVIFNGEIRMSSETPVVSLAKKLDSK